jgi:hypothetical protein
MVVHEKLRKLLSGDDVKAIQKIVIAVGHICVKETSSSLLNISLELIFSLSGSKVGTIFFFLFFQPLCLYTHGLLINIKMNLYYVVFIYIYIFK